MIATDGGPAFPTDHSTSTDYTEIRGGMSLRDYFAGQALAGFSVPAADENTDFKVWAWDSIAEAAYLAANAMLKARLK